jgi:hypothetical protein
MPDNAGYMIAGYLVVGVSYLAYGVALLLRSRRNR